MEEESKDRKVKRCGEGSSNRHRTAVRGRSGRAYAVVKFRREFDTCSNTQIILVYYF